MWHKLFNNWILKLASLVLATIIWTLVIQTQNPPETKSFGNIKVNLTNTELLDAENKVYEVLDNTDTVRVTVRAPRTVVNEIRSSDIVAEADISKLTDINTILISYYVQNVDDESVEIIGNHDVVRLSVEEKASKYVAIKYNTVGEAADGYMVGNISLDQNMIEVSGPKSAVETVSVAKVDINVAGASSSLSANMEIKLYDKEGNVITQENIDKQTDYARVSVEILATKEVPVEVNYEGEPADGYMATGVVESDPSTVKIAGNSVTLSNINKITIPAENLNIDGAEDDVEQRVDISGFLPNNVRLADSSFNGRVNVTIYVEPIVERTLMIPSENLSFINIPEGLEAVIIDDMGAYELNVEGLGSDVNPLSESGIRGTVDVSEWMNDQGLTRLNPGTYYIPVSFTLDEGIEITNDVNVHVHLRRTED